MTLTPYSAILVTGPVASAATETYDIDTRGRRGLIVCNSVSVGSAFSETCTISGLTPSGLAYTILAGVALVAVGQQILQVAPALVAVANQAISAVLPAKVRITLSHTDATAITRTIEYELVG